MRDIVDDERRGDRAATSTSPKGCGSDGLLALSPLLDDVPHRLRRRFARSGRRNRNDIASNSRTEHYPPIII